MAHDTTAVTSALRQWRGDGETLARAPLHRPWDGNGCGHQAERPVEAEILVLCDHTTVTHGLHDDSVCETDTGAILPPDTIRRLCRSIPTYDPI